MLKNKNKDKKHTKHTPHSKNRKYIQQKKYTKDLTDRNFSKQHKNEKNIQYTGNIESI